MEFSYKAIDSSNQITEGVMSASSETEVINMLRTKNLSPITIKIQSAPKKKKKSIFASKKITKTDINNFTTRLSALTKAKMPLAKSLESIKKQSEKEEMAELVHNISEQIKSGSSLSGAFENYPKYFSKLYVNLVKIGEVGGVLEDSLLRISEIQKRDQEVISTLKSALTYPLIMFAVMVISIIILITFVVPKFTGAFGDMGMTLPLPTQILIIISDFMQNWWWLLLILLVSAVVIFLQYIKKDKGRLNYDKTKLKIPLLGKLMHEIAISRFTLSLGSLLKSGISLTNAMDATVEVTGNSYITQLLRSALREVHEGQSLSAVFEKRTEFFTSLCIEMAQTGEDSGNLDEMLENIGQYYADESSLKIKTITSLMEPMIIVIMGVVVGFIVMAMMLPIFDISTSIH
ncbi:MAG: type II secretion system F family protein [Victivallales bacterium]|nr:type II secretion system F family protein [Victivallales bacterium]MCF7888774.1 type II secretion system F family protein [Victivallales bacterium]